MTTNNDTPEQQLPQVAEETPEQEGRRSRWRGAANRAGRGFRRTGKEITRASRSTGRGLQRSGEVVADATTDAAGVTKRGAVATGQVLSGADIRRFDEFTEAVTRVAVGLHHEQADIKERVARLEQEAVEIRQSQAELAERMAVIERMLASQQDEDAR